jgi:beta-glucosidase-like glycosyl hydrolase
LTSTHRVERTVSGAEPGSRPWRDTSLPAAERVDLLLAELTLDEKVAQLGSRWIGNDRQTGEARSAADPAAETTNVAPMENVFALAGGVTLREAARHGLGHLTRVYGSRPLTPAEGAAELIRQQQTVLDCSRLGIPALVHEECLTGFTAYGATVYPAAIAWGATFDPPLVQEMAAAIGRDMAAVGVHQGLSPVLDVVRDYRWGRVEETMGEDPYVVATLGAAYVRGLQSAGVIATLKHFAGYSASRAGRNHGPVPMGRRELLDVIFPPFETAVTLAGAGSVMSAYNDVDGVPASADSWLLTEILRDQWNFAGTVVSDYWSVPFLSMMHRVGADAGESGVAALVAGVDVELPDTIGFDGLAERVRRDEVAIDVVDRAARRLLLQKVALGLLDPDWTPEASVAGAADIDLDSPRNRELARRMAERSVVLLDEGTALPLLGAGRPVPDRIALIGPCAADPRTFMGCYAFANHVLPRYPGHGLGMTVPSVADALERDLPGAEISYEQGCQVQGSDRSGIAAAVRAVASSDVCIAVVGDLAGLFGNGSSGEGCDASDLALPGVQAELLEAAFDTGVPVVVVVVSGRPYALGAVAKRAAGLIQAFMPGVEGAGAIAGVVSGRVQPGGKLPVQIPRSPGGQPGTHLQPPLGVLDAGISSIDPTPLFPFGYGRSYTTFELDGLTISADSVPTDGEFTVSVRVRNIGDRAGDEVVQLYLQDPVASVARPVNQLIGYARVNVPAATAATVTFTVHADRTAFTGRDLTRIVEPGQIDLLVGTSVADLPCRGTVWLTGAARTVGSDRALLTPATVTVADTDG